jgi:membrane fusion protein, heavy metal efflux system
MKRITLMAIALIIIAGCGSKKTKNNEEQQAKIEETVQLTDAQVKSANISTLRAEERSLSSIIKVNGKIDVPPQNLVSVSMPLGGYLKYTKLLPGMYIRKGEEIATMEDQQYIQLQQDYLTTKARLEYADAEFKRQRELNEEKASSDKAFQQSKADYQSLKIALKALSERLQLININPAELNENNISKSVRIFSPIDGYVSKVLLNVGKYINPAEVMFELVDPSDIHLNLTVFEKDLMHLSIGQKLKAYTNTDPNKKYDCEIILINKDVTADRSSEVHCHFIKYDKSLLPGMYMNAEIEIKSDMLWSVPEPCIVSYEGENYVFIDEGNKVFRITKVQTGANENGYVAILNAQAVKGKNVVGNGSYALLMALKNKAE